MYFIIGYKETGPEPKKLKLRHFFPHIIGNIVNHCYLPNSTLLFDFASPQDTFDHDYFSERFSLTKFELGITSQNIGSPQPRLNNNGSSKNSNNDQNSYIDEYRNLVDQPISLDLSTSDGQIPKNQFILDCKKPKFTMSEKVLHAVKHSVELSDNIDDTISKIPDESFSTPVVSSPILFVHTVSDCLIQFVNDKWFKDLFTNHDYQKFSEDPSECISVVLTECSLGVHQKTMSGALSAIIKIESQVTLSASYKHHCAKVIVNILLNYKYLNNPSFIDKEFIFTYLEALEKLCSIDDKQYLSLLLFNFLLGNFDVRHHVMDVLEKYGFCDPFRKLSQELDSWDIHDIKLSHQYSILINQITCWLDRIYADSSALIKKPISDNKPTYVDAMNQFVKCSRELISEDVNFRQKHSSSSTADERLCSVRSVISLPKIYSTRDSVRLGQKHFSGCHTRRESTTYMGNQKSLLKDVSHNVFLQIPIHNQNIILPALFEEPSGSPGINRRKKYFKISQSYPI